MKKKLAAVILVGFALTACSSAQNMPGRPDIEDKYGNTGITGVSSVDVSLNDGRSIPCVIFWDAAITCDWVKAK